MANDRKKKGSAPGDVNTDARPDGEYSAALARGADHVVTVRYQDTAGDACSVDVALVDGVGPASIKVPGGTVIMSWGETMPETLLSARFEADQPPTNGEVRMETAPERALRIHAGKSTAALKADIVTKQEELAGFARIRDELAALKYVLALRIGSAQIEIGGAIFRAKRPSGKGERVYPLTLVSQTQLATYDGD